VLLEGNIDWAGRRPAGTGDAGQVRKEHIAVYVGHRKLLPRQKVATLADRLKPTQERRAITGSRIRFSGSGLCGRGRRWT
jgi:hypothetical protein